MVRPFFSCAVPWKHASFNGLGPPIPNLDDLPLEGEGWFILLSGNWSRLVSGLDRLKSKRTCMEG